MWILSAWLRSPRPTPARCTIVTLCARAQQEFKTAAAPIPSLIRCYSPSVCTQIHASLLHWYDHHHRVLPWRRTPHSQRVIPALEAAAGGAGGAVEPAADSLTEQQFAYHVWVSEIMLQQTQVRGFWRAGVEALLG